MIVPTSVPKMKKPQNDRASEYCPRHSVQYHAVFAAIGISSAGNRGALSAATEAASPAESSAGSSAGKAAIRPLTRKIVSEEANGPVTKKPNSPQRLPAAEPSTLREFPKTIQMEKR